MPTHKPHSMNSLQLLATAQGPGSIVNQRDG
jgi:hypothetical protein